MNNPYSPPAETGPFRAEAVPAQKGPTVGAASEGAVQMMRLTRPWVVTISVLCFLGSGFMILAGLLVVGVGMMMPGRQAMQALIGVIYIPMGLLYIYPGIKLWQYGSAIGRLVASRANADLEEALAYQKSFWKFSGISAIVMIAVYFFAVIGLVAVGVVGGMSHMR
jgi:hypothetical protein